VIRDRKWREQLLDRLAHTRDSDADLAEIVLALDDGGMLSTMLVFDGKPATCYVADEPSGVWRKIEGPKYRRALDAVEQVTVRMDAHVMSPLRVTVRMDAHVMSPLRDMIRRQQTAFKTALSDGSATPTELERLQSEKQEAEEHLLELSRLYARLRKLSQQQAVLEIILNKRLVSTIDEGVTEGSLDVIKDCLAFLDGVFCFREAKLLTHAAARAKYQTMTTGYRFEDLRAAMSAGSEGDDDEEDGDDVNRLPTKPKPDSDAWDTYDEFVERIYSATPGVRQWLTDVLASSALSEVRQMIVFHYKKTGSNGKSTYFELIRNCFGELHEACQSVLLSESKRGSSGSANEDLVSIKGKRVVQMTEVCSKEKLSASAVKEATGGDQQSARGLYQKKQKFVCVAILHVLCNSVPVFNDEDGGTTRRVRCVEYGSTFVDAAALMGDKYRGVPHVYEKHEGLGGMFASLWKYYLMYEVMEAAVKRVRARLDHSLKLPVEPKCVGIVDAWAFGHTHHAVDRIVGRTRVLSNPLGYAGEATGFSRAFVFTVEARRSDQ